MTEVVNRIRTRILVKNQRRRERQATDNAVALGYVEDTVPERRYFVSKISVVWSARRRELLDNARKAASTPRLPRKDLTEITESFWADIDEVLAEGKVPYFG